MNLLCVTLALDSAPWLACVFVELNRLKIPWEWIVVEGRCDNQADQRWMTKSPARLSVDGTHEFLRDLAYHPRIKHLHRPLWPSKTTMLNAALAEFREDGILMQIDSDELWRAEQLEKIVWLYENDPSIGAMQFKAEYFVGPNLITENGYGNRGTEWLRSWRWKRGTPFQTHEPPKITFEGRLLDRDSTERFGLVFRHYSWTTRRQCHDKSLMYGKDYQEAVSGWEKLQKESSGNLQEFFPWAQAQFRRVHD